MAERGLELDLQDPWLCILLSRPDLDLRRLTTNPSADVRYAAVHGLMPHDIPKVVAALAKLSRDSDRDVRNWATFTLGSQFESRSPTLCTALQKRVTDPDPEIRGEALVGLARRGDVHRPHCSTRVGWRVPRRLGGRGGGLAR